MSERERGYIDDYISDNLITLVLLIIARTKFSKFSDDAHNC